MDTIMWLCTDCSYGVSAEDAKSLWSGLDQHWNMSHQGPTPTNIQISFGYTESMTCQTATA